MRLFTLDDQIQICDCLTSFCVSYLFPIQFRFNSAVNVRRQTFKISIQLWTATAHVWPYFEQNRTSGVHTDRTSCRNDWPRGFHDFTFLCVIRSPSRVSTARTNITDTFPSIVVTNVEEVWLKNASSRGFKGPASSTGRKIGFTALLTRVKS